MIWVVIAFVGMALVICVVWVLVPGIERLIASGED